jgi:AraC-like DNA-binding protein
MVCVRCKMAVEAVLKANNIAYNSVELGRADLADELTPAQRAKVAEGLLHYQLELMEDPGRILVERIKTEIITLLQSRQPMQLKLSVHLSKVLNYNYTYLANTFSEQEGMTLERFFISQRVERVKELIVYEYFPLVQIAEELGYSSVSHLSQQFKKVTGITPAEFRKRCQSDKFIWRKA